MESPSDSIHVSGYPDPRSESRDHSQRRAVPAWNEAKHWHWWSLNYLSPFSFTLLPFFFFLLLWSYFRYTGFLNPRRLPFPAGSQSLLARLLSLLLPFPSILSSIPTFHDITLHHLDTTIVYVTGETLTSILQKRRICVYSWLLLLYLVMLEFFFFKSITYNSSLYFFLVFLLLSLYCFLRASSRSPLPTLESFADNQWKFPPNDFLFTSFHLSLPLARRPLSFQFHV